MHLRLFLDNPKMKETNKSTARRQIQTHFLYVSNTTNNKGEDIEVAALDRSAASYFNPFKAFEASQVLVQ